MISGGECALTSLDGADKRSGIAGVLCVVSLQVKEASVRPAAPRNRAQERTLKRKAGTRKERKNEGMRKEEEEALVLQI
jgi:hypothetical protein